ncbi:unnamed protein product, partial [Closterium sp. Naga37s-1]
MPTIVTASVASPRVAAEAAPSVPVADLLAAAEAAANKGAAVSRGSNGEWQESGSGQKKNGDGENG